MTTVVIVLAFAALVLASVEQLRAQGQSLIDWAVIALAVALLLDWAI